MNAPASTILMDSPANPAVCTNPHPLWRDQPGCHCSGHRPDLHWMEPLERRAVLS